MISALLLGLAASPANQSITVDLFRGAKIGTRGYWAVSDTYLDSTEADKPKGGLFTLEGGKGRTILIKFGDLENSIPQFAKITSATLYLSPSSTDQPVLTSIATVKASWGEGPMFAATLGKVDTEKAAPQWAATWKQRRNGRDGIDWQQTGATGPDDTVKIASAKVQEADKEIAITGLAPVVQTMRDKWFENNGFALSFDGQCEFFSSQAKNGKPRLVVEYILDSANTGSDLSVQWIDRVPQNPRNGEEVTYRAVVKNVGSVPAAAFSAQWVTDERAGAQFPVTKALGVNEETVIEFKKTYKLSLPDHRMNSVQLRVFPGAPEPNSNNDALSINENAIPIAVSGAKIQADGLQATFRSLNDVYFEQSRFSFATDGVLERVRWIPGQEGADYVIDLLGDTGPNGFIRQVLSKLTGLASVNGKLTVDSDARQVPFDDPYLGVSGFGDTRYEGLIPPGIPMLYVPVASPIFDNLPIEPTDLLCGTEVAAINLAMNKKGKARTGILWDLPSTVILRATDMTGKPLDGAELAFYQIEGGKLPSAPTQTILTKEGGTVILENREVSGGILDKDALHQLKKNPFGNLSSDGSNGTILIRALINGETEWGWLKAWQLSDAYQRGNKAAAIIDVRFNAPAGPLDLTTNLAKGRLLSDKSGSLPAKLAALVDEDNATEIAIGTEKGDWIEIDLGRDRPIGEIRLTLKNPTMPAKFDIQTYATGQTPPDTDAWVKDLDFNWTLANRGQKDGTALTIPYRGPMVRSRYIRIVNRSGGAGNIAEIRVVPLKAE